MNERDIPGGLLILNNPVTLLISILIMELMCSSFVKEYAEGRRKTEGERVDWRGYKKSIGQRRSNEVKKSQQVPISVHKRQ